MSADRDPDIVLELRVRDTEAGKWNIELYQREGRRGAALAAMLRQIADGFDDPEIKRIG